MRLSFTLLVLSCRAASDQPFLAGEAAGGCSARRTRSRLWPHPEAAAVAALARVGHGGARPARCGLHVGWRSLATVPEAACLHHDPAPCARLTGSTEWTLTDSFDTGSHSLGAAAQLLRRACPS